MFGSLYPPEIFDPFFPLIKKGSGGLTTSGRIYNQNRVILDTVWSPEVLAFYYVNRTKFGDINIIIQWCCYFCWLRGYFFHHLETPTITWVYEQIFLPIWCNRDCMNGNTSQRERGRMYGVDLKVVSVTYLQLSRKCSSTQRVVVHTKLSLVVSTLRKRSTRF